MTLVSFTPTIRLPVEALMPSTDNCHAHWNQIGLFTFN